MIIFFSGDGPARTGTPEKSLIKPAVMLSYDVNVRNNKPDARFRALIQARQWQEAKGIDKMHLFFSGQTNGPSLPERVMAESNGGKGPCLMLTYHEIYEKRGDTILRFNRHKLRKEGKPPRKKDKDRPTERIWMHFLDSGAHSIYTRAVLNQDKKKSRDKYAYYDTDDFWKRVDDYASFVKKNTMGMDFYANLDVIFCPERTWKVQRYLEDKHKLKPIPVIHYGTPLEWVKLYLAEGYDFIGLGGLGQEVKWDQYHRWANGVYDLICPKPKRIPLVRTHGFAMTTYDLLIKYPWWSVDSASWVKAGGYGIIYVPHKRDGEFTFKESPYNLCVSADSPYAKNRGKHTLTISKAERKIVDEWLEKIGIPYGRVGRDEKGNVQKDEEGKTVIEEYGVESHHGARKVANLVFFKMMEESMPEWPWRWGGRASDGFGIST